MFGHKFAMYLSLLHTPQIHSLAKTISMSGSSAEVQLQKLILKYPHRQDLKLKLMELQKTQNNIQSKRKSKKKKRK